MKSKKPSNFEDDKINILSRKRISNRGVLFGLVEKNKVDTKKGRAYLVRHWYSCREVFHDSSHRIRRFFLHLKKDVKSKDVAAFITKIESKLKVKPRTKFCSTNDKTVVLIKPSPWWTRHSMRRSLFTILLRAGQNYSLKKDNFEEALFSEELAKDTEYAVRRFLKGYTKYKPQPSKCGGQVIGWHQQFYFYGYNYRKPTDQEIENLLVKP